MRKFLLLGLVLSLCACSKQNTSTAPVVVGKWNATSRTVVYTSADNKELSRINYPTTTATHGTNMITSFYYVFDSSGNFSYYQYNLTTSAYTLFEPGDKYALSNNDNTITLSTPSGGSETAALAYTDNNNIILAEVYSKSVPITNGNVTTTATVETDYTYFTRAN